MKVAHPLPRLRSGLTGTLLLVVFACLLTACITSDQALESNPKDPRAQDITDKIRALDLEPRQTIASGESSLGPSTSRQPAIYLSDGTRGPNSAAAADDVASGGGFDLNFDNAPVATVAKVILGDIMGVGYSIDPRVQGTVTLASVRPIPKIDALFVLENALRMSNVALLKDRNGGYRLIPANEAGGSGSIDRTAAAQPGQGISVVPLRYVSAQNIFKLLDAFGVKANTIRPDVARNTLIIQGSGADRNAAIETIQSFDADWMRGQSVGIFPLRNSAPEPVISEIEKIMDSGEGGMSQSMIKFQPIARLNSILVVSQKPEFLKRAGTWVARLDQADMDGTNLKVYPLRYGNSRQVTALLNEILVGQKAGGSLDSASGQISPGSGISSASSPPAPLVALSGVPPASPGSQSTLNVNIRGGANNPGTTPADTGVPAQDLGAAGGASANNARAPGILPNIRITADTTNNSILVYANREAHRIIEQTIRQIDRPQRQIAIEATIAEVTLNDNLNYGVQFFLSSQNLGLKPDTGSLVNNLATAATSAAINRVLPGFNLLVGSEASPRVVLDALHGVTNVKVLSNPSLVVLDNQTATLQVGDQVPVSTGSATVLTTNNTVVNTIDYRNTGIILRVLPRANANGNVVLDIEQEISNVAAGTPATSLTPTVSQRRVKSSISVVSGQTVLLAGLISEREDRGRQGIPVLDQIPGVGDAFGRQTNARSRTELILFIRPTVVRDALDAHLIAEELRSKMNGRLVGTSLPVPVVPSRNAR